jgi:hypothetical protein
MSGTIEQERPILPHVAGLIRLVDPGRSCFVAGTAILMADGHTRFIEAVRPGDRVVGRCGRAHAVTACLRGRLGRRRLYRLNGGRPFVTASQPFLTTTGWKALDPAVLDPGPALEPLRPGDSLCRGMISRAAGPGFLFAQVTVELASIEAVEADPSTRLYDLALDGEHGYVADGWVVHDRDDRGLTRSGPDPR